MRGKIHVPLPHSQQLPLSLVEYENIKSENDSPKPVLARELTPRVTGEVITVETSCPMMQVPTRKRL